MALGGCDDDVRADGDAGTEPVDASQLAADDAGGTEADAGTPRADAGPPAPDAGPGTGSVRWVTVVEPREVDRDIALDYAFQYELTIDGDPFAFTLSVERCVQIAGTEAVCDTGELSNLPGSGYIRFGVDPSMYAIGENHYTFRLMLDRGTERIEEATLDVELDVTACESCVGSDAEP